MKKLLSLAAALVCAISAFAANPYMPLWEYIPDGEPYVFEDPDHPGQYRVYVYGSHDTLLSEYCGRDQVVWSAAVDDLNHWRYGGVIFTSRTDRDGKPLNPGGIGDVLYAPDVVEKTGPDGRKTYYLYPNNQARGRNGMIARSDRPDGPFTVCNWSKDDPTRTDGMLGFDPGVFIDDDGRVYGYWGFKESWGAELDPETMATVKKGSTPQRVLPKPDAQDPIFRFFEASSIRKIGDKYVFVYSRVMPQGEEGLPSTNYDLAYAWSNSPLGPYTYGGTVIDCRGRDVDDSGNAIVTASPNGNTHGGLAQIGGQWYIFFHRQAGLTAYARQAMVAPVNIEVTPGPDGKVVISEAEYTSEGFETDGLDPMSWHSAGIACYYTGPEPAVKNRGGNIFHGPYIEPRYTVWGTSEASPYRGDEAAAVSDPYSPELNSNPVVGIVGGSVVGYKYFNFDLLRSARGRRLLLSLVPSGASGRVTVMADHPAAARGGIRLGKARISGRKAGIPGDLSIRVRKARRLSGKHALYFVFDSRDTTEICRMEGFIFK